MHESEAGKTIVLFPDYQLSVSCWSGNETGKVWDETGKVWE